ncbi:MAG: FHA domain-containing protein [Planctomycetota bacterium]
MPKQAFSERFGGPFLLELNPEDGVSDQGETQSFDPAKIQGEGPGPSLERSQILYFANGQGFSLGRAGGADIPCSHSTVSDVHCRFESFGSIWAIKDEGSKNGTFVNGRRLNANDQSPLKFGTKIMTGSAQFLFLSSDDCFDLIQELSREPRIRPRSLGKYTSEFTDLGDAEKVLANYPGPFLVVQAPSGRDPTGDRKVDSNTITLSEEELKKSVNRNVTDAIFDLSKHNLVRIGRATVTQIHLPLGAISNLHAALVRDEDGKTWKVQDLGAKNGTYVWGDRLPPQGCRVLESGSEITLGNIKSIFFDTEDLLTYATHRDTLV